MADLNFSFFCHKSFSSCLSIFFPSRYYQNCKPTVLAGLQLSLQSCVHLLFKINHASFCRRRTKGGKAGAARLTRELIPPLPLSTASPEISGRCMRLNSQLLWGNPDSITAIGLKNMATPTPFDADAASGFKKDLSMKNPRHTIRLCRKGLIQLRTQSCHV